MGVVVVVVGGCASPGAHRSGAEVAVVIDVRDALTDGGPFAYRYTSEPDEAASTDEAQAVVVEGRRDVLGGTSTEVRTTTTTAAPVEPGSVDVHPSENVVARETVTVDGATYARRAGEEAWIPLPDGDDAFGDGYGETITSLLAMAEGIERFTYVSTDRIVGGGTGRRFRGVETGDLPVTDAVTLDVWLDRDGRLARVATSEGQWLDLWDHGTDVDPPDPSPLADVAEDEAWRLLDEGSPWVSFTGPWDVEAEGTVGGRPWQIVRTPGRIAGIEVPCRMFLVQTDARPEDWDDAETAVDDELSVCGARGGAGLVSAVADPAIQVLISSAFWEAGPEDAVPIAMAVSPRFAAAPAVLVGVDGSEVEVVLDAAGFAVVELPPAPAIASITLAGGTVTCDLGVGEADSGFHAVEELSEAMYDGAPVCTEA